MYISYMCPYVSVSESQGMHLRVGGHRDCSMLSMSHQLASIPALASSSTWLSQ